MSLKVKKERKSIFGLIFLSRPLLRPMSSSSSSSSVVCYFDRLPPDLFRWIVSTFFEDEQRFALVTLLVLLFVSRRFRDATRHSRRWMSYKNTAPAHWNGQQYRLGWEATTIGRVSVVEWLLDVVKFRMDEYWAYAAAEGGKNASMSTRTFG